MHIMRRVSQCQPGMKSGITRIRRRFVLLLLYAINNNFHFVLFLASFESTHQLCAQFNAVFGSHHCLLFSILYLSVGHFRIVNNISKTIKYTKCAKIAYSARSICGVQRATRICVLCLAIFFF